MDKLRISANELASTNIFALPSAPAGNEQSMSARCRRSASPSLAQQNTTSTGRPLVYTKRVQRRLPAIHVAVDKAVFTTSLARSARRSTFPIGVFGSSVLNSMYFGHL